MISFKMTKNYSHLNKLHKRAFPGEYVRDFTGDVCWFIYFNGKLAGFCSIKDLGDDSIFLSRSGVFLSRKGLHRKSIAHRLRWARRNGFSWAVTYVSIDNFKSMANLVRSGFEIYEPASDYAGKGFLYFRKKL